jgi:hypothetical protein
LWPRGGRIVVAQYCRGRAGARGGARTGGAGRAGARAIPELMGWRAGRLRQRGAVAPAPRPYRDLRAEVREFVGI